MAVHDGSARQVLHRLQIGHVAPFVRGECEIASDFDGLAEGLGENQDNALASLCSSAINFLAVFASHLQARATAAMVPLAA